MLCVAWLTLALFAACASTKAGTGGGSPEPSQGGANEIHLSWASDPKTTMVVQWHTSKESRSMVIVRRPGQRWKTVQGKSPGRKPIGKGVWHETELVGLESGKLYEYSVSGDGGMSREYSFKTAPPKAEPFRFDAFADQGDCRTWHSACQVQSSIADDHPDLVLAAGDLTYADDNGLGSADRWMNDIMIYSTSVPVMPCWGNHEATGTGADSIRNYKGRFDLPPGAGEDYYSFNYSNVHFIALPEPTVDLGPGSPFRGWLDRDLSQARSKHSIRWIVAFAHRPFFSTGQRHGSFEPFDRDVMPLLDQYKVDLVINGHEHNYERTLPMRGGVPVSTEKSSTVRGTGTFYVVTGGGGAPIYDDFGPKQRWDAVRVVAHEHLRVDVSRTVMHIEAISETGKALDGFEIAAEAPSPSPSPGR